MKRYSKWIIGWVFFLSATFLFYCQSICYHDMYPSDLPAHIEIAKSGNGYSLLYFLMSLILNIFKGGGAQAAIACLGGVLIVGTYIIGCQYIVKESNIDSINASFISGVLIILCCIYIPILKPDFYTGSLITQPWHNITYIGMRLFSLLVMHEFLNIIDDLNTIRFSEWMKITILLMISTSIKPSFFIMFAPVLGCLLIKDKINKRITVGHLIKAGGMLIPSLWIILLQTKILYGAHSNSGIIFSISESVFFKDGCIGSLFKVVGSLTFPIAVFLRHRGGLDRRSGFICAMHFVSIIQAIFFEESGERAGNGNFWWGCMFGGYMFFAWCIPRYILDYMNAMKSRKRADKYLVFCGILFAGHIISGITYFGICLSGGYYYC